LRILLSNHHLQVRAGSELYTWELASALQQQGHDVRVFTLLPGPLVDEMRAQGLVVHGPDDTAALRAFRPQVLHVHHGPCLWSLGALGLDCPMIFSSLGVLPPHEAAPNSWAGVAFGVAVSEEVRHRLGATPFGRSVPLRLSRNWYDDRGWSPAPATAPREVRRIAVVSNHLSVPLQAHLEALQQLDGVTWTHFGLPHASTEIRPELLAGFDAVITIGRTALLAAAVGRPCLLLDVHGCDGLMAPERLEAQASVNFSGRLTRHQPTFDELRQLLLADAPRVDVAGVQGAMIRDYRLTARASEWAALYGEAIASPNRLDTEASAEYRPLAELYGAALEESRLRAQQVRSLEAEARRLRDELARVQAETEQLRAPASEESRLRAQRVSALEAEAWRLREELVQQRAETEQLRGSAGLTLIRALQRLPALYPTYLAAKHALSRTASREPLVASSMPSNARG
jgi:hypothetical protein